MTDSKANSDKDTGLICLTAIGSAYRRDSVAWRCIEHLQTLHRKENVKKVAVRA